jgi:hypothetical protein
MHNHKAHLNRLKALCNNAKLWDAFVGYLDEHVNNQNKIMEQTSDEKLWRKAQGAIAMLRKLQALRDEANVKEVNT